MMFIRFLNTCGRIVLKKTFPVPIVFTKGPGRFLFRFGKLPKQIECFIKSDFTPN